MSEKSRNGSGRAGRNGGGSAGSNEGERKGGAVLVTGFPSFLTKRLIRKILAAEGRTRIHLLVHTADRVAAEAFLQGLPAARRRRVRNWFGDATAMDFGLAGQELREIASETVLIHHLTDGRTKRSLHAEAARRAIDVAEACDGLQRLCLFSTTSVSGTRRGVVIEEELDCGQSFFDDEQEARFQAERVVRGAMRQLPITILRPSMVVGDSKTGEYEAAEGALDLFSLLLGAGEGAAPTPPSGAPLHVVPVDFVIEAAYRLSGDERARGRTFHLVDPCPLSSRAVHDLVTERAGERRRALPALARALFRPGAFERLMRSPRSLLEGLGHTVLYNCKGTLELLRDSGIACPPFDSYVDVLVRQARETRTVRTARVEEEIADPFDR